MDIQDQNPYEDLDSLIENLEEIDGKAKVIEADQMRILGEIKDTISDMSKILDRIGV